MAHESTQTSPILKGSVYDVAKKAALVWLPSIGTLYFALAGIWGLPAAEEVVGSIVAVDTFLGVVLHISNTQYNNSEAKYDGNINVTETDDKLSYNMQLKGDPAELKNQSEVTFKVNTP